MRVVSVAEMREIERQTFAAGVAEHELQQRAAAAVARAVVALAPADRCTVALVGPGNNGRDAAIAAADLLAEGWGATLYLTPRHAVTEAELRAFVARGGRLVWHPDGSVALAVEATLAGASVAIDGLLGIGGHGPLRSPLAEIVEVLNGVRARSTQLRVVAVDAPSGLDADTGEVAGPVVRADVSVVLGGAKRGLLAPRAARFTGRLHFADIGVVDAFPDRPEIVDDQFVRGRLTTPAPEAHKGAFGRLLVVAGSERYVGAAFLACAAAARTGAGIVTLAAPRWLRDVVGPRLAEATFLPLPDPGPAGAAAACAAVIDGALEAYDALVVGPGLSLDGEVIDFVARVLRARAAWGRPVLVDADGLNALARLAGWTDWIGDRVVLTPHLGELRRLTGAAVELDGPSWELAEALADRWGVTLVIKGPCTAIGAPGRTWVHPRPNPALATAGTGDVLSGIVGGLLARGLAPDPAAPLGVWVHGTAGAMAAGHTPAGGLLASDLLAAIPAALGAALAAPGG